MTQSNMSAIATESLQTSLQNFWLDHHDMSVEGSGFENETCYESTSQATLEQLTEQCLDLKTREAYYINWRTGIKTKEDPRRMTTIVDHDGYFYSNIEEDDDIESYSSSYELGEGSSSSSESSSAVSSSRKPNKNEKLEEVVNVLVVAGCKRCLMYLMVAKHVVECPKCNAQLLHFDTSLA